MAIDEHVLQQVTARLSAAATREDVLSAFLDEASRALGCSAAVAYLAGGGRFQLAAHRGISDGAAGRISALPLETLERDLAQHWREVGAGQALVTLPLRADAHHGHGDGSTAGAIIGAVGLSFPETRVLDGSERQLVTTLASRVQEAFQRASLLEESQRGRAEAEHSRDDAEALLRFNEVVSGILAHDLRNPLAAILMNARMLKSAESERSRTIGARIVTSGERMSRMIDQILEWTRLRVGSGRVSLQRTRCDLAAVADDVVGELRVRRADIPIALSAEGDLVGQWDADRLAQVVSNLVGNALEHASRPGVSIRLTASEADVRLAVENEGRIDAELMPLVFEPFRGRASGSGARGRGLGLGLYITRAIVAAHGGRMEVEHEAPRVTFVVTLPRAGS